MKTPGPRRLRQWSRHICGWLVVAAAIWIPLTLARATSIIQQSASLVAVRLRNDGSPQPQGADCGDAPCVWDIKLDCDGRIDAMFGELGPDVYLDIELAPEDPE